MTADTEFAFFRPVTVTAAMLTSSTVAEPAGSDPTAWNAATAYTAGQYAARATTHRKYIRLISGTTATAPESDAVNWADAGPLNRWAMFDQANETQTSATTSFVVVLAPGERVDCIGFDNVDADSIRVQSGASYDETITLRTRVVEGLWSWLFERFAYKTACAFLNLPPISSNSITITVTKTGSTAKVGTCLLGRRYRVGRTKYGASRRTLDYSYKNTDSYGSTTVVEGAFAKEMSATVWVTKEKAEDVARLLDEYRATPLMWLGAGGLKSSLLVYGFCDEWEEVIPYPNESLYSLKVQGLT
jgi:hypothetical protein